MTLLEMVVYIGMFAMIMVVILQAIATFYRSNRYTIEQSTQLQSARIGIATMVQNLREMVYSDTGGYPIVSVGANNITFFSNIDTDSGVERVRFFLDNGTLKKGILKASGNPLAYNPTNEVLTNVAQYVRNADTGTPIFTYYDKNGVQMTDLTQIINIAWLKVSLIVNVNPLTMPNEFDLRSSATFRNLKTNL